MRLVRITHGVVSEEIANSAAVSVIEIEMPRKPKLPRPTYRQHGEDVIHGDIRARVIQGTPMFDFLSEVTLEPVEGANEFERGVREGRRRLAGDLIGIALSDAAD